MGYVLMWNDLIRICKRLNLHRVGKTSVWKGIGADGKVRVCTIHSTHRKPIGAGLLREIATQQLLFSSVDELYGWFKENC